MCTEDQVCLSCGIELAYAQGHILSEVRLCHEDWICAVCFEVVAEAVDHNFDIQPEIDPTCNRDGVEEGRECISCGYTEGFDVIPMLGHHSSSFPTCLEGTYCDFCSISIDPPLGHSFVELPAENGQNGGLVCINCEEILRMPQVGVEGHGPMTAKGLLISLLLGGVVVAVLVLVVVIMRRRRSRPVSSSVSSPVEPDYTWESKSRR